MEDLAGCGVAAEAGAGGGAGGLAVANRAAVEPPAALPFAASGAAQDTEAGSATLQFVRASSESL